MLFCAIYTRPDQSERFSFLQRFVFYTNYMLRQIRFSHLLIFHIIKCCNNIDSHMLCQHQISDSSQNRTKSIQNRFIDLSVIPSFFSTIITNGDFLTFGVDCFSLRIAGAVAGPEPHRELVGSCPA